MAGWREDNAGRPMYVMQPFWRYFGRLDGFETAAVCIAGFTGLVIAGFILDYLMHKQGFGVIFNSALVALGVLAGIYVRLAYATPVATHMSDPVLSIVVILATITVLMTSLAILRNRFW